MDPPIEEFRLRALQRLSEWNVWRSPNNKVPRYTHVFFIDWDDSILPSTFLANCEREVEKSLNVEDLSTQTSDSSDNMRRQVMQIVATQHCDLLKTLGTIVLQVLDCARKRGPTYIVTNATLNWVKISSALYLPPVHNFLFRERIIPVISARELFQRETPDPRQWKIRAFLHLQSAFDFKQIVNLISIGDSGAEIDAASAISKNLKRGVIKIVKLRENPTIETLIAQQNQLCQKLEGIISGSSNIRIEFRV